MTRDTLIRELKRRIYLSELEDNLPPSTFHLERDYLNQMAADGKRIAELEKAFEKSVADVRKMTHFINLENSRTIAAMEALKEKAALLCESPGHPTYEALLIRQINFADILKDIERKSSGVNDE